MLGFALELREGELIYSVLARYAALLGRGEGRALVLEHLGVAANVAAVDLPAGMRRCAERLGSSTSAHELIQKHTLFPYLYRFAPAHQAERAREWLLGGAGRKPARIGVAANRFELPVELMFCPSCLRADRHGGPSAWLSVHQLPGVLVCPADGTPLRRSGISRKNRRGLDAFVALTPELVAGVAPPALNGQQRRHLLSLAQDSAQLLESAVEPCCVPDLQQRLRDLLRDYRWSRAPSLMATTKLVAAFRQHPLVHSLMSALDVQLTDGQIATAWNRLLYSDQVAKHPLMVLIALRLAGASLRDLSARTALPERERRMVVVRTRPETRIDLPCHNPVCERYGAFATGTDVVLTTVRTRVRCVLCGFVCVLDPARPARATVVETAPSWDRALLDLVSDTSRSVREIGRRLGVAPNTVMRHARRLGAWRPEWKDRPKLQLRQVAVPARLLERHRAAWLASQSSGPAVPIKRMARPAFNAYRYLIRHDRMWLEENTGQTAQMR